MRGHAAVNGIGELLVAFFVGFDDRGGVNAGGGAECVAADDGIIRRNRRVRGFRDGFGILLEPREVLVDQAEQPQIYEHQFHRRVADAFAERERGGVNLIGAGGNRGERIRDGEAAIVVAVPIDANFFAGWLHDFFDCKFHQIVGAARRGVADGVAQHDGARAGANCGGVQRDHSDGVGANRVFGDVHHGKTGGDGEFHGVFGGALEMIHGPIFDQAANRARAEKRGRFDVACQLFRKFR